MSIKSELQKLKETDLWSLLLFVMAKLKDSDDYSSLCELAFVLDKPNFINLCEYFGGCTITIPTIDELELLLYGMLLYQYIDIEHLEFENAVQSLGTTHNIREIKNRYHKLKEVLSDYEIYSRGKQ